MLVARGYYTHPETGKVDTIHSLVMFGYSKKVLRHRIKEKPGIKKITVEKVKSQYEETIIAEGLLTRARG
jgi:hypothetical protein